MRNMLMYMRANQFQVVCNNSLLHILLHFTATLLHIAHGQFMSNM